MSVVADGAGAGQPALGAATTERARGRKMERFEGFIFINKSLICEMG